MLHYLCWSSRQLLAGVQALREMDARGVSFLRRTNSQCGDLRLLVESPECSLLSAEVSEGEEASMFPTHSPTLTCGHETCFGNSSRSRASPMSCQTGFSVA